MVLQAAIETQFKHTVDKIAHELQAESFLTAERIEEIWKELSEYTTIQKALEYEFYQHSKIREFSHMCAFLTTSQVFFYLILQEKNGVDVEMFASFSPASFNKVHETYFAQLQSKIDFTNSISLFRIKLFQFLPESEVISQELNKLRKLGMKKQFHLMSAEFIGRVFQETIPLEVRKKQAVFYTQPLAAKILAGLTIKSPKEKVLDLACGSGTLLHQALRKKQKLELSEQDEQIGAENSRIQVQGSERGTEIYGNEWSYVATQISQLRFLIASRGDLSAQPQIYNCDCFQIWCKNGRLGAERDIEGKTSLPPVDVILMNPPFSRHQGIGEKRKKELMRIMQSQEKDQYVDEKFGLHCYCLLHADQFLKEGGKMGLVLPISTFTTLYTDQILQFFYEKKYRLDYIIEINTTSSAFSENCAFKEYMVVLEKGAYESSDNTALFSIHKSLTADLIENILANILEKQNSPLLGYQKVPSKKLYVSSKWTRLFSARLDFSFENLEKLAPYRNLTANMERYSQETGKSSIWNCELTQGYKTWRQKHECSDESIPFITFDKMVIRRGFNSKFSKYLMLPNSQWSINHISIDQIQLVHETSGDSCTLPSKYYELAIRRSEYANSVIVAPNHVVLSLPKKIRKDPTLGQFQRTYLKWASSAIKNRWTNARKNGHHRVKPVYKSANRDPWWNHSRKTGCSEKKAHLLFPLKYRPLKRKTLAAFSKTLFTTNDGLYLISTCADEFYASWMNSAFFLYSLFLSQQIVSKGFYKMQVKDFDHVLFPLYSQFKKTQIARAINAWKRIAKVDQMEHALLPYQLGYDNEKKEFGKVLKVRLELDCTWAEILEIPSSRQESVVSDLYKWLVNYMRKK